MEKITANIAIMMALLRFLKNFNCKSLPSFYRPGVGKADEFKITVLRAILQLFTVTGFSG